MAKDDSTMWIVGGLLVAGLGAVLLFKDQILGAVRGAGETVPGPAGPSLEDDMIDDPPIQKPTPVTPSNPVHILQGIDYYATRIAEEIDKNDTKTEITRTTKLNIKGNVLLHHKSELKKLVELQDMQIATGVGGTSLNDKSLQIFATILLKVVRRMNITLTRTARLRFEMQAAGKYKIMSQMAITLS